MTRTCDIVIGIKCSMRLSLNFALVVDWLWCVSYFKLKLRCGLRGLRSCFNAYISHIAIQFRMPRWDAKMATMFEDIREGQWPVCMQKSRQYIVVQLGPRSTKVLTVLQIVLT